jgi:hypothetical protein
MDVPSQQGHPSAENLIAAVVAIGSWSCESKENWEVVDKNFVTYQLK